MRSFLRLLAMVGLSPLCSSCVPDHADDTVMGGATAPDAVTGPASPLDASVQIVSLMDAALAVPLDAQRPDAAVATVVSAPAAVAPLFGVHHWNGPHAPALVDAVGSWLGRPIDLAMTYAASETWAAMTDLSWQALPWSEWLAARPGRRLLFSIPMLPGEEDLSGDDGKVGTEDDVSLAACASGAYDVHWRALGKGLVEAGLDGAILRLGWEADGPWFTWTAREHIAEYAACFRSAVNAIRAAAPTSRLEFDWSVSDDVAFVSREQLEELYPGDSYVDVMSVNAYDVSWEPDTYPFPADCAADCKYGRRLNAWNDMIRGVRLVRDFASEHQKPFAIAEWGLWQRDDGHGGGDNTDYVQRMKQFIDDPANHVFYQSYFDVDYIDGAHQLSDVSGMKENDPIGHDYKTSFPLASAVYKALFGTL